MTTKKMLDEAAIAKYRTASARRRARRNLETVLSAARSIGALGTTQSDGVVTVRKPVNAKPVSSLGGPTKVFGPSRISVPELRRFTKRSTG